MCAVTHTPHLEASPVLVQSMLSSEKRSLGGQSPAAANQSLLRLHLLVAWTTEIINKVIYCQYSH